MPHQVVKSDACIRPLFANPVTYIHTFILKHDIVLVANPQVTLSFIFPSVRATHEIYQVDHQLGNKEDSGKGEPQRKAAVKQYWNQRAFMGELP